MKSFSFRDKIRYKLDAVMSRGTIALVASLFIAAALVIIIITATLIIINLRPKPNATNIEMLWTTFMHVYDPSQIAYDEGSWLYKGIIFLACLCGIFILSTLIGVLTTGFDTRLQELRKGKSIIIEKDHILILGWSDQIFSVINELIIANENQKKSCIAILADKDKVEMEDEIKLKVPERSSTKIVCRTGSPMDIRDLAIVSPERARSIILLPPDDAPNPDSYILKILLALINNPHRASKKFTIVAGMQQRRNLDVARIIAKDEAHLIPLDDIISQIISQTCRQPGLSLVYTELLDFGGDELYFKNEPKLAGKTFAEAMFCYETSCVIGLRKETGEIVLKPPMEHVISANDSIIAISKDDDTVIFSEPRAFKNENALVAAQSIPLKQSEKILILGWNDRAGKILRELEQYIQPGSRIVIITDNLSAETQIAEMQNEFSRAQPELHIGDITNRTLLDKIQCDTFDSIIVLSNCVHKSVQEADAETLITLVHLRDISEKALKPLSVVSEMLDDRNRELANITSTNDFIVSSKISSLILTQLSQNPELLPVFTDLFDADGSEIYLKSAANYIRPETEVDFQTVVEAARRHNEIAIGFKKAGDTSAKSVVINPSKYSPITFKNGDSIIIIAEN
ncbi:MAG: NAD-binding protein [Bacteroidota bacterium]